MSVIKKETIDVRRIGTALIGGDFTGNARGNLALDIQIKRSGPTIVASGANAIAIGWECTASGIQDTAIGSVNLASGSGCSAVGHGCDATGINTTAVGSNCTASGNYSSAVGRACFAIANYSVALGRGAKSRVQFTTNICGPIIQRKDDGETAGQAYFSFCGVEVIFMSKEVDMKVVADHTITLPANCQFWLNEIGIIARTVTDLVTQPTVRYGITGDLDKHNAAAITTALTAADKREIETPLVPQDGETSFTGGITIAADATTFLGRFYWKGMFIEDE